MIKKIAVSLSIIFSIFSNNTLAMNLENYSFFDKEHKKIDYDVVLETALKNDVILFGELHNNPIAHWLQLRLTKDIFKQKKNIVLGGEMFQSDDQQVIDDYLNNLISEEHLKAETRLWKNYPTDYKPIMDFAFNNKIKYIGTNIPIRYANMVSKKGISSLESLPENVKNNYLPKLPFKIDKELPNYKNMLLYTGNHGSNNKINEYMVEAQASKDATMAFFINKNLKPNYTFIHYNGTYHSNNFEGIYWYLKKENSNLKIMTISSVEQEEIDKLEEKNLNLADFTLCITDDMTKTY
ncbi:MAG: ChaN family lipoprotein [Candidatus Sericytochromatia bacterium]